jgi:hypothetical protein
LLDGIAKHQLNPVSKYLSHCGYYLFTSYDTPKALGYLWLVGKREVFFSEGIEEICIGY